MPEAAKNSVTPSEIAAINLVWAVQFEYVKSAWWTNDNPHPSNNKATNTNRTPKNNIRHFLTAMT